MFLSIDTTCETSCWNVISYPLTDFLCMLLDFTDVPLREDQREYICKAADGYDNSHYKFLFLYLYSLMYDNS